MIGNIKDANDIVREELEDEVRRLQEAKDILEILVATSFEAYAAKHRQPMTDDEYDVMMDPLWKRAIDFIEKNK